jgi:hypothetical protein
MWCGGVCAIVALSHRDPVPNAALNRPDMSDVIQQSWSPTAWGFASASPIVVQWQLLKATAT